MKRLKTGSLQSMISNIATARKALGKYSAEKVDYVKECYDEIGSLYSDYYLADNEEDESRISREINYCKKDYLVGAIEDNLMTEDEFNDIYQLLDIIGLEEAHSMA